MAAGDVTVDIIATPFTEAQIDTAITTMRSTVGDTQLSGTILMTAVDNQIVIVGIQEI